MMAGQTNPTGLALSRSAARLTAHSEAEGFSLQDLRIFQTVPRHHHDVAALLGFLVVYETDTLGREDIIDGGLYVVEDQHPVGGMSWDTYDRFNREHGPGEPRVRINTSRRVIRAVRRGGGQDNWWHIMASGGRDGPYYDWAVALNMVGKVVGVYQPSSAGADQKPHPD